jgi:aryl-alcohol dehydrogenase-like predicted oxidoreductase
MIRRVLGRSGIEVPAVAIGTWAIGGTWWGGTDQADSIAAVRAALDAGIGFIDTAPIYGFGRSEEIVGRAIAGRDRSSLVVATKCGLDWEGTDGPFFFEIDGRRVHRNLRPARIRREVEDSLRRLGVDSIDLIQTHWQDPTTPIAESMGELVRLRDEGKVAAIGVSNATTAQMNEYLSVGPLASNQAKYSMLDRGIEAADLPFCRDRDIAVLAYSPLALGLLTGTVTADRVFGAGDQRRGHRRFTPENIAAVNALLVRFDALRRAHGLTMTQLAIAWTISRPGVTTALVGVRTPEQAREMAGGGVVLAPADMEAMDAMIAEAGV